MVPPQGLGKKLRHLGVDCVILEDTQTVDDAAKIALSEGRVILSRDSNCERLIRWVFSQIVLSFASSQSYYYRCFTIKRRLIAKLNELIN